MLKEDIIYQLYEYDFNPDKLKELKKKFSKINKLKDLPSNISLLQTYRELVEQKKIEKNKVVEQVLKKRSIRSESGIVAVQVLTKPFWCPGKCIFCPNDPEMPKSYIKTEPGAMRALFNAFDPIKQVYNRLRSLGLGGHDTNKIEMIVLGGTRDVYPEDYKISFIKWLYDACNTFDVLNISNAGLDEVDEEKKYKFTIINPEDIHYAKDIDEAISINETAKHRIIWLTLETRPEYVTDANCAFWRKIGITRIEMGVQSLYDEVLDANKRGHSVEQIRQACHKLRQRAFKFCVHVMPGLYKSDYAKDLDTFQRLYDDKYLKPDEIKFYPTSVIKNTELYDLYKKGEYKPLETDQIKMLIEEVLLNIIPAYTRIKRLIRDIPATEIEWWSNVTNLHQLVEKEMQDKLESDVGLAGKLYSRLCDWVVGECDFDVKWNRNFISLDTRSREVRHSETTEIPGIIVRKYESSVWDEYFISFEDRLGYIYGFTRLLLPKAECVLQWVEWLWEWYAMIRELHVYGGMQQLWNVWDVQHIGFGKQLMLKAEEISKNEWYKKLSVISGIGVREYYRKLGFDLEGTYLVKNI